MKVQNIIIGVLLVSTSVFAYLFFAKKDCLQSDPQNLLENCSRGCWAEDGEALSENRSSDAKGWIENYLNDSVDPTNDAVGYHIGLTTLETMLSEAKAYNLNICKDSNPNNNDSIVTGYRFYNALTTRPKEYCEEGSFSAAVEDLIAVPALKTGEDIYEVGDFNFIESGLNMYTYFRPCPKLCGRKRLENWDRK